LAVINKNHHYTTLCEVPLYVAQSELSGVLLQRATHCITEQARVLIACAALKENNITLFAEQLIGSHESLKTDYEVTGLELDALYNAAITIDGCLAARMTGAGFGGCAIALVATEKLEEFKTTVAATYVAATGLQASFHPCNISNGVGLQAQ
jgi:galactokinase